MTFPIVKRVQKFFTKTITFTGAAGAGAIGTVTVATITGNVGIKDLSVRATTTLAGASATVALGSTGNTSAITAATTATGIIAGYYWHSTTPANKTAPLIVDRAANGDIIITVATAAVTAGVLVFEFYWENLSADARIV